VSNQNLGSAAAYSAFSTTRVMVVGDVMLDRYWHGATSRISPEAPVPVVSIDTDEFRLGGAGNVALNAAALGAETSLLGLVGDDDVAVQVQQMLEERSVRGELQRVPGSSTITKLRIMSRHQQLIRLDFDDHFPSWDFDALLAVFERSVARADVVVLSDYAKGTLRRSKDLIAAARRQGVPVVVDPKGTDFERYRGATIITPNQHEFEAVVGKCEDERQLVERAENLRVSLDLDAVLVTRSEQGMLLIAGNSAPLTMPTQAQEVFDVTGAGDTVVAALGVGLAARLPLPEAVAISNLAAGIVVGKLGTATVTVSELMERAQGPRRQVSGGFFTEDETVGLVADLRQRGSKVVMTNGCFDILHPGHVDYLEKARALGDVLIVALNDDDSVRRLKGSSRPVNGLAHRARMLLALSCVDYVVPFADDTPERLYCRLLPDLLVKGGDYAEADVAGGACVKAAGGQVRILPFVEGFSTTDIISRIQKR
jgi:D-beta-D-heptose 7-phosphate kinase / D-beta-D-heptose 1-phosphate adenosyltransferase